MYSGNFSIIDFSHVIVPEGDAAGVVEVNAEGQSEKVYKMDKVEGVKMNDTTTPIMVKNLKIKTPTTETTYNGFAHSRYAAGVLSWVIDEVAFYESAPGVITFDKA